MKIFIDFMSRLEESKKKSELIQKVISLSQ
jgi:hypothetical protein